MDDVAVLLEKERIVETITDLFIASDERDWPAVLACLAPQVFFDMSSLTGTAPSTLPAEQIVAGWEQGLAPLKAVHHQAGNFKVRLDPDGRNADAFCYGIASHYLPNPTGRNTRVFVASYDYRLAKQEGRWRITRFRFNLKYVDGNLDLEQSV